MRIPKNNTIVPIYESFECATNPEVCSILGTSEIKTNSAELYPVGFVYIQFPNQSSPADLFPDYRWENITPQYAGAFFRVEGGNASAFESGLQDDATATTGLNTSLVSCPFTTTHAHCLCPVRTTMERNRTRCVNCGVGNQTISCNICQCVYTTPSANGHTHNVTLTGGVETRPINYTIRLWKRTA